MMPEHAQIHYLLTPDSSASRRLRRLIAEQGGRRGVVVGTWPELQELLRSLWGLPVNTNSWDEQLHKAAATLPDAFWTASLAQAEVETCSALGSTLAKLIEAAGPAESFLPVKETVSKRVYRRLKDLSALHTAMQGTLPPHLATLDALLAAKPSILRPVVVYHLPEHPFLNPWQAALLDKLSASASCKHDPLLHNQLLQFQQSHFSAPAGTRLAILQKGIFQTAISGVTHSDSSLQFCAVRDPLMEAEVAAGMVQTLLKQNTGLVPHQIGLLLPDDPVYPQVVADAFAITGLPLSGLTITSDRRDLGRESVHGLLRCLNRPAPIMALADLLCSPLMPWDQQNGMDLAQTVMDGNFKLQAPATFNFAEQGMLKLLRTGPETSGDLITILNKFIKYLNKVESLQYHRDRAVDLVDELSGMLTSKPEIPWQQLLAHAVPTTLQGGQQSGYWQEGVAVFKESDELWREVRHLLILGFKDGHFPQAEPSGLVFNDHEMESIREDTGIELITATAATAKRRALLQRQISMVSDSVTVLLPRRDFLGEHITPSASLNFIAGRLGVGADHLLLELDTTQGIRSTQNLPIAAGVEAIPPRTLQSEDLQLNVDLITRNRREDGSQRPESPSSLETMMVSPLVWLLDRLHVSPRDWAPEELDIMSKGTLAHDVFEHLLPVGQPPPDPKIALPKVRELLMDAITRIKPFLMAREWKVERENLATEIEKAAAQWLVFLHSVGAKVLGCEVGLEGMFDDLPVRGSTDLLLELPDNRIYVVDYKKASSKARRDRMELSYDHQASLYRTMIETGGPSGNQSEELGGHLKAAKEISVLYFMMNDQVVLADSSGWLGRDLAGCYELGENISAGALALIRERLSQLKQGIVLLNNETDEKDLPKQTGIKPYALDNTPLARLFMHYDKEAGQGGEE